jgi:signal transduction histidine kinase
MGPWSERLRRLHPNRDHPERMSARGRTEAPAPTRPPPSAGWVLSLFALGSAAAIAVAVVGGYLALRAVAIDEAKRDTQAKAEEAAKLVESVLADGVLTGDPDAVGAVDDVVLARVLDESVVRVKLWSADGRVLYSDEPAQIGGRFRLGDEERAVLREGGAAVEVSDLDRPENALDRQEGELIEAYTRARTPSGTPVLVELYERFDSVTASARRLLVALAPPLAAALALVLVVQVPLVWSLTRRLQRGYEEREELLAGAIAASNRERRRIASYLHDGPVQDLAGLAYALAPLADGAATRGDAAEAAELRGAIELLRRDVRDLRALLVDLHPPRLAAAGLEGAVADLVAPLAEAGLDVTVSLDGAAALDREQEALVYRVIQEALRNVVAYAGASAVSVEVAASEGVVRLAVVDDGRGFDPELRSRRAAEGHVGLTLLEELVRQSGGTLELRSRPGEGTRVELEVPRR